jgi:hypothetical protein
MVPGILMAQSAHDRSEPCRDLADNRDHFYRFHSKTKTMDFASLRIGELLTHSRDQCPFISFGRFGS